MVCLMSLIDLGLSSGEEYISAVVENTQDRLNHDIKTYMVQKDILHKKSRDQARIATQFTLTIDEISIINSNRRDNIQQQINPDFDEFLTEYVTLSSSWSSSLGRMFPNFVSATNDGM